MIVLRFVFFFFFFLSFLQVFFMEFVSWIKEEARIPNADLNNQQISMDDRYIEKELYPKTEWPWGIQLYSNKVIFLAGEYIMQDALKIIE